MAVRGNLRGGRRLAESRYVNVTGIALIPGPSPRGRREFRAPSVIGGRDVLEVRLKQFTVDTVNERAELAGVNEQGVLAAVAEAAFGVGLLAFREEPQTDADLSAVKKLAAQRDHAIDNVGDVLEED